MTLSETKTVVTPNPLRRYVRTSSLPTIFCTGCGGGTVLNCFCRAVDELGLDPKTMVMVTGIGCSSWIPSPYFLADTLHTTHGRAITFATGVRMMKPEMKVVVIAGDGDISGIGGNHLIHAARRNIGIKMILINNGIYGMTGGQVSPLTPPSFYTETTPYGNIEPHFNVRKLLTAAEATFVARETVNRLMQLKQVIKKSFQHKGFSVVEVMSNCHVNLGRRNKMKSPLVMTKYIRDITMSLADFEKLSPEEQAPKYPLGIFVDESQRLEYTDLYYNHIVPVAQQAGAQGGN